MAATMVSRSPSGSLSLANTSIRVAVFRFMVGLSGFRTGGLLVVGLLFPPPLLGTGVAVAVGTIMGVGLGNRVAVGVGEGVGVGWLVKPQNEALFWAVCQDDTGAKDVS